MRKLERPDELGDWKQFHTQTEIAWKTGTSNGSKDAWAVGVTPKYAVGVWAGNADGEGRPGLTGINTAAPILFDVFEKLPRSRWFDQPYDEMIEIEICKNTGHLAKHGCPIDSAWVLRNVEYSSVCPYHKLIYMDESRKWEVNKSCSEVTIPEFWFTLPPVEEHFYKSGHPNYRPLPRLHPLCKNEPSGASNKIQLIYPVRNARIYVPVGLRGNTEKAVFKAVHSETEAIIYWHIDNNYIGSTKEFHHLEVAPEFGRHTLTLMDQYGNRAVQHFEIISDQ